MMMVRGLLIISLFISFTACAQTPNLGFEDGNFGHWQCYIGHIDPGGVVNLQASSPVSNRHTLYGKLYDGNTLDPYGNFPVLCPNGSNYSIRLGNSDTSKEAERISYTFVVPNIKSYSIVFNYAVVLENPDHLPFQQPKFTAHVFDVTDQTNIECPAFDFAASSKLPGFRLSSAPGTKGASIYYKDWSTATIDLSHYIGKTIRLEFTTNDCTKGQHFGYAYLDLNDNNANAIGGNAYCNGERSVTLYAPIGFAQYFWYNGDMTKQIGVGRILTISPPPPDNTGFAMVALPYDGVGCRDTLHTLVNRIDEGFRLVVPDTLICCPGSSIDLTAREITAGTSPNTKFGYFTDSLATTFLYNPSHVTASGVYYIQGVNAEGCSNILPVTVLVSKPEITVTDPAPVDFPTTVDLTKTVVHKPGLTYSYFKDAAGFNEVNNYTALKYGGTYYIKASSPQGCSTQAKVNVVIHPPPPYTITAPNTFTPNNDGINDSFSIVFDGIATLKTVKIYDRYGHQVYNATTRTTYWDGTYKGRNLPVGVYYWILDGFDDYNQVEIRKAGSITLLK